MIRVEHLKFNQATPYVAIFLSFWSSTRPLADTRTDQDQNDKNRKVPPATLLFKSKLLLNSNLAGGTFPLLIFLVLISVCVCRMLSWTQKTQPGGSSAATWLSFWCSTRLLDQSQHPATFGFEFKYSILWRPHFPQKQ